MESPVLAKKLFRSLFRLATKFDREPFAKAFIYRNKQSTEPNSQSTTNNANSYSDVLNRLFRRKAYFFQSEEVSKFRVFLKEEFRKKDPSDTSSRIDTALFTLKKFSELWISYSRRVIPRLFDKWVESDKVKIDVKRLNLKDGLVDEIKSGVILVAHPLVHGPFARAVVLVLGSSVSGTYGIVINRAGRFNMETAIRNLPDYVTDSFGNSTISFGGMIRRLQVIHGIPECGGLEIPHCASEKLFSGADLKKAVELVKKNPELVASFRFYVGCCVWTPQALSEELEAGYWIPCEAAPDSLLGLAGRSSISVADQSSKTLPGSAAPTPTDVDDLPSDESLKSSLEEDVVWPALAYKLGFPFNIFSFISPTCDSSIVSSID